MGELIFWLLMTPMIIGGIAVGVMAYKADIAQMELTREIIKRLGPP